MLLKAFISNSIPTLIKIFVGVFLVKFLVSSLGKDGFALISQFQSLGLLIFAFFNSLFFNYIVINYKHKNSYPDFKNLLGIVIVISFIITGILLLMAKLISQYLFHDSSAVRAIYIFALTCPFTALFVAYTAQICAEGRLFTYNLLSAFSILISTIMIYKLTVLFGREGAYIGFSLYYFLPALFLLIFFHTVQVNFKLVLPSFNKIFQYKKLKLIKLGFFGILCAVNAISLQIFTRTYLASQEGWLVVGDWQAITKISESYLLLVTVPLATFILPEISKENKRNSHINLLIKRYTISSIIFTVITGLLIFLLWKSVIVKIIGSEFYSIRNLWFIQLAGDVFKVITWILGTLAIAKMRIKIVLISELFFSFFFIGFLIYLVPIYHIEGVFISYFLAYFFISLYLILYLKELTSDVS